MSRARGPGRPELVVLDDVYAVNPTEVHGLSWKSGFVTEAASGSVVPSRPCHTSMRMPSGDRAWSTARAVPPASPASLPRRDVSIVKRRVASGNARR